MLGGTKVRRRIAQGSAPEGLVGSDPREKEGAAGDSAETYRYGDGRSGWAGEDGAGKN